MPMKTKKKVVASSLLHLLVEKRGSIGGYPAVQMGLTTRTLPRWMSMLKEIEPGSEILQARRVE
jgi:hypothetical protein